MSIPEPRDLSIMKTGLDEYSMGDKKLFFFSRTSSIIEGSMRVGIYLGNIADVSNFGVEP